MRAWVRGSVRALARACVRVRARVRGARVACVARCTDWTELRASCISSTHVVLYMSVISGDSRTLFASCRMQSSHICSRPFDAASSACSEATCLCRAATSEDILLGPPGVLAGELLFRWTPFNDARRGLSSATAVPAGEAVLRLPWLLTGGGDCSGVPFGGVCCSSIESWDIASASISRPEPQASEWRALVRFCGDEQQLFLEPTSTLASPTERPYGTVFMLVVTCSWY